MDEGKKLVLKYGSNVDAVFNHLKFLYEHGSTKPLALHGMLLYGMEAEMVMAPSDIFIRRKGFLYFDIEAVRRYKLHVLRVMEQHLGYTETQRDQYLAELEEAIKQATNFVH